MQNRNRHIIILFSLTVVLICHCNTGILHAQNDSKQKLALQYFQEGAFEKSAQLYEELYTERPNEYFYRYYINSLLELKDYKTAERFIKEEQKRKRIRKNFTVELAYIYLQEGNIKKSERFFENAINEVEATRQGVYELTNALIIRGQYDYAILAYQKGRKLLNGSYNFHIELAGLYQTMRNYSAMMDEYLTMLEADEAHLETVEVRLQHLINVVDDEECKSIIRDKLIEKAQKNPKNLIFSEMLLWYTIQIKDFPIALVQAKALDKRTDDKGERVYELGVLAASNDFFDEAIDAFNYVIALGPENYLHLNAQIKLLETKYNRLEHRDGFDKKELLQLEKEYNHVLGLLGKNSGTIILMKNLAHMQAFYLNKIDEAVLLLETAIKIPHAKPMDIAACKIELADILLMSGDNWEATLLYSQVEKAFKYDAIGYHAKFKNAKLSFYIGEFEWARTQLDILRSATSKLIANDAMELSLLISDNIDADSNIIPLRMYAGASLQEFRKNYSASLFILDSIESLYPYHNIIDEVLLHKARIHKKRGNYLAADSLYTIVYTNYNNDILADNALIECARLNEHILKNKEKAIECYRKILFDHSGSLFVTEARRQYRLLKEDQKSSETSAIDFPHHG